MKADQIILASFPTVRDAAPLLEWLDAQGVSYKLSQPRKAFDAAFAFNGSFDRVGISVSRQAHAGLVERLKEAGLLADPEADFFEGFSDAELREVVEKADEWEAGEVGRAEALLKQRGIQYSDAEKAAIWARRKEVIRKAKTVSLPLLLSGVFIALACWGIGLDIWLGTRLMQQWVPLLPGLFPMLAGAFTLLLIGIGWNFTFLTRKDPWGEEYFVFDSRTRKWGLAMLFLGSALVLAFAGINLMSLL